MRLLTLVKNFNEILAFGILFVMHPQPVQKLIHKSSTSFDVGNSSLKERKNKSMLSTCLLLRTKANMAVKSGCYFVTRHKRCAGVLRASVLLLHETLYKKNELPELQHCRFGVSAYLVQENPHVYF